MEYFYDVLVQSLHPTLNRHNRVWVRDIRAGSLGEACKIAEVANPNLGCTHTITSVGWLQWPQKEQA